MARVFGGYARMFSRVLWTIVAVAMLQMPAVSRAETPASQPETTVQGQADAASLLSRVGVIGASATCGFGVQIDITGPYGPTTATVDFAMVLGAMLPAESQINHHGSLFFFNAPMNVGPEMVSQALLHEPTLIVGIDYLFWYGYGYSDAKGKRITEESARLELLELGLSQLERFECPVVVGDYPNMAAAVGRMLGASQLPELETLAALNKRVREWAKDRPNVTVVSLSTLVGSMQAGEEVRIGEQVWTAEDVATVIQDDQLHPTLDGLVLMAQRTVADLIAARDDVTTDAFQLQRAKVVARVRADIEAHARELVRKMEQRQAEQSKPVEAP